MGFALNNEIAEHHSLWAKKSLLRHTLCSTEQVVVQKAIKGALDGGKTSLLNIK